MKIRSASKFVSLSISQLAIIGREAKEQHKFACLDVNFKLRLTVLAWDKILIAWELFF